MRALPQSRERRACARVCRREVADEWRVIVGEAGDLCLFWLSWAPSSPRTWALAPGASRAPGRSRPLPARRWARGGAGAYQARMGPRDQKRRRAGRARGCVWGGHAAPRRALAWGGCAARATPPLPSRDPCRHGCGSSAPAVPMRVHRSGAQKESGRPRPSSCSHHARASSTALRRSNSSCFVPRTRSSLLRQSARRSSLLTPS